MQRILDPAQIEAFAQRTIPRVRLPDGADSFSKRAQRLRKLSENHAVGDYLRLMAAVSDAQQAALGALPGTFDDEVAQQRQQFMARARSHGMPPLQASGAGWPRDASWRTILIELCDAVAALPDFPPGVRDVCNGVRARRAAYLEEQADLLLAGGFDGIDVESAPFIMAALQVYWVHMATSLPLSIVKDLGQGSESDRDHAGPADASGVCPVCGSLPVASVVRADKQYLGYRYLHCGLCATEWHLVRVKCSQCLSTEGIAYQSVEGASAAVLAEACENCHTYRKILYQEKDTGVEPVADDLGTLALDLLMAAAGYHRGSSNPFLWQSSEE